jgi:hypothetical protein
VRLLDLDLVDPLAEPTAPAPSASASALPLPADGITLPSLPFTATYALDLTGAFDQIVPECGTTGTGDIIVKFRLPAHISTVGFEARLYGADGAELDQVLEIRPASPDCETLLPYPTGTCSDDSTPPGRFGSRVFGQLEPEHEYLLVASVYSNDNLGPSVLEIFVSAGPCTPQCEGKTCGSDGCPGGRQCGRCGDGNCCYNCLSGDQCRFGDSYCTQGLADPDTAVCEPGKTTCTPDCKGRSCGPSRNRCPDPLYNASAPYDPKHPDPIFQCGHTAGKCGMCTNGLANVVPRTCDLRSGRCRDTPHCDSLNPTCPLADLDFMAKHFCGSDCHWHALDEEMVDLVIGDEALTASSFTFAFVDISPSSPALLEGCLHKAGKRLLMRFDTWVHNVGRAGYYPPSPGARPDLFEFRSV